MIHNLELVKLFIKARLVSQKYLSEEFALQRDNFKRILTNLLLNSPHGTKYSFTFSPTIDSPLSLTSGTLALAPSRYAQDFEECKSIGKGGFGEVFKVGFQKNLAF
jgi:hypothetical protein